MQPVTERSATAWRILLLAAPLGLLGDLLFNGADLGINMTIWVAALAIAATLLARQHGSQLPDRWLLTAVGFALCLAWRHAEILQAYDVLAIITSLALTGLAHRVTARGRLSDYVAKGITGGAHAAGGTALLLAADGAGAELERRVPLRGAGPVVRGLLLAVPIALVFGSLFIAADPQLEAFVGGLFDWNAAAMMRHVLITLGLAWLAAGLMRGWFTESKLPIAEFLRTPAEFAPIPAGIALGTMVLLFLVFVASQSSLLFADAAMIESRTGMTFANHARQGFFEMVAASALSLPVLYGSEVLVATASDRARQSLRAMGSLQLVLTGLVMISALQRFWLYITAYGLTEDRIIGVAIIVWLTFVTAWFAVTVLRGRADRFTFGAVVSGFTVLALLNVANPEALMARVNTARATRGLEVDREHLGRLSADAAPALAQWAQTLPADQECEWSTRLRARWLKEERDWRGWNRSVSRAVSEARRLRIASCAMVVTP